MSVDPAIFRALVAQGASPEMLLAVVEAAAAVEEEKREKKRAGNAKRQAEWRERNASNALCDVTERDETPPPVLDKETSPRPPKEINLTPRETPRARRADPFALPSDIPEQPWDDFEEMRRRIGKPMTNAARRLAVDKLRNLAESGWPPGDVLNHCTMNSYQGIFPPTDKRNGRISQSQSPGIGRTAAAALDVFGYSPERH